MDEETMPTPSTQSTEWWMAKRDIAITEYQRGEISPSLFRAKLYRLGFRGSEIESEIRLYAPTGAATSLRERT